MLCDDPSAGAIGWGSYPMAPWAGRLRDGRFAFDGTTHQLPLNHTDEDGTRHAIHGTVFDAEWTVDEVGPDAITLHCPLDTVPGWPFAGTARQTISRGRRPGHLRALASTPTAIRSPPRSGGIRGSASRTG